MQKSHWFAVVALIVVALGLVIFGAKNSSISSTGGASLASAVDALDHMKGDSEASVTLVEYSDFQCPACRSYAPVVKSLMEEYGDRINFVYRHFPLPQHTEAITAALAAEAAGKQGKFFEMHDLLFANQDDWAGANNAREIVESYAVELGLDMEAFALDIDSEEAEEKIKNDIKTGQNSRVMGTPTFFLNGAQISNPKTIESFKTLIEDAINNA